MLCRESVRLGRARLAVQVSSPGFATRILIPAPGFVSGGFSAAVCVVTHLGPYVLRESHNINVRVFGILQNAWLSPSAEDLPTHIHYLTERRILSHGFKDRRDTVGSVVF